jgi:hypothetical protein
VKRGFFKVRPRLLAWLWLCGCCLWGTLAAGDTPGIARTQHTLQKDRRVIVDRLDARKNPSRSDESFLNAVGAVWAYSVNKSGPGYAASTRRDFSSIAAMC